MADGEKPPATGHRPPAKTMTIIALYARDWAGYDEQYDADTEFNIMCGWVIGHLLREDDEKVVIAHHWFPKDKQVRHVTVVQKSCIVERVEFKVDHATPNR